MVSFARAKTRSLLSRLWPVTIQTIENNKAEIDNPIGLVEKHKEQNKCFLEASKNGGMWFS
tara:strand:+ start:247 stop:429 length:183 start_codon:yes stop_codon:yes gene_type:complete